MFANLSRYALISFLKFVVTFYGLFSLYSYILPEWVVGNLLSAITWIAVFIISFLFATWAFHPGSPTDRDITKLVIVWLSVTIVLLLGFGIFFTFRGARILFEGEILIQLVIEVVAIILAGILLRRRALKQELGEGGIEIREIR